MGEQQHPALCVAELLAVVQLSRPDNEQVAGARREGGATYPVAASAALDEKQFKERVTVKTHPTEDMIAAQSLRLYEEAISGLRNEAVNDRRRHVSVHVNAVPTQLGG
jgi:hypothetical protein